MYAQSLSLVVVFSLFCGLCGCQQPLIDQLTAKNAELDQKNGQLDKTIQQLKGEKADLTIQVDSLKKQLTDTKATTTKADADAKKSIADLTKQLADTKAEAEEPIIPIARLSDKPGAPLQIKTTTTPQKTSSSKRNVTKSKKVNNKIATKVPATIKANTDAEKNIADLTKQLTALKVQTKQFGEDLTAAKKKAEDSAAAVKKANDAAATTVKENKELKATIADLEKKLKEAKPKEPAGKGTDTDAKKKQE